MPSSDSGDDFVWVGGPGEGFGIIVGLDDEAVDGGLEVDDTSKDTALESPFGEFGEEPLDGVEPRAGGRGEVEGEARVAVEPLANLWMLVGGVVVEDHVHDLSSRHLCLNGVEEADELLVTMALHASADDLALEYVESSEQRCCAMAFVVVGLMGADAVSAQQDDLGPPDMLMCGVAIPRERYQTAAVTGLESDANTGSHAPDSHATNPVESRLGFKC